MLPTVQYLLMAIYCIILSAQHKRRSMSVSVCQVGLRRTAPWSRQNSSDGSLFQNVHSDVHRTPQGAAAWCSSGCHCARMSLFVLICVSACVYPLAFVCTFPMLTGWPAAVLESLLTESVRSAGYFYPLACVREQVEALWATTRSHNDEWRYATICGCSGQTSRSECPFYKDTACDHSKESHRQNKSFKRPQSRKA